MAKLDVVIFPDERLRQHCKEVTVFDDELKKLVEDMFETMYADDGVGLAAPQVGISKRLVVMEVPFDEEKPEEVFKEALVNPIIIKKENPMISKEGCLSVPDYVAEVERFADVTVKYQTLDGEEKECTAHGLHAVCIQHELDHLDGKLFIDMLSRLKRQMLQKKYTKLKRREHLA